MSALTNNQRTFPVLDATTGFLMGYIVSSTDVWVTEGDTTVNLDGIDYRGSTVTGTKYPYFRIVANRQDLDPLKLLTEVALTPDRQEMLQQGKTEFLIQKTLLDLAYISGDFSLVLNFEPPSFVPVPPPPAPTPAPSTGKTATISLAPEQLTNCGYFDLNWKDALPPEYNKKTYWEVVVSSMPPGLSGILKAYVLAGPVPLPNGKPEYTTIRFVQVGSARPLQGNYVVSLTATDAVNNVVTVPVKIKMRYINP